jgi:hypothetical protein
MVVEKLPIEIQMTNSSCTPLYPHQITNFSNIEGFMPTVEGSEHVIIFSDVFLDTNYNDAFFTRKR